MNPALFRKLVERKLIKSGTLVGVEYTVWFDNKKVNKIKGLYTIKSITSNPFALGPIISIVQGELDAVTVEVKDIRSIENMPPNKYAAQFSIRADGNEDDAPKRRGRKPKVRTTEEWHV